MRLILALTAMCLGLLAMVPETAEAQRRQSANERRARRLFEQGDRLYAEGRYEESITAFEEAYSLSERPALLFNIANAQERLGNLADALETLRRYYTDAPASERETLDTRMRNLEERIAEQERQAQQQQQQQAPPRETRTIIVREVERPAEDEGPSLALPLTLMVGGGALIAGGVVFGVIALGARSDAEAMCRESGGSTFCPDEAGDALSRDTTFSILADASIGVGAVVAALGLYFLVSSGGEDEPASRARAGLVPRLGGGELRLDAAF